MPESRLNEARDDPASRFGESRFGPSRFEQSRFGAWIQEGKTDAQGRTQGLYRSDGNGPAVAELTVVRPAPATSAPAPASASASAPKRPTALNLSGGPHGVLLFHGLSSTPLELQYLARGLNRAGYTVRLAVIDGYTHGLPTREPRGHRDWAAAALAEFDRMRQQCDAVAVGGLCIGSVLALYVATQRPSSVSHILALSTTLHYDGWAAPRTRWFLPLARLMPWFGSIAVKEREPYGLKDDRLRAWVAAQMKESGGSDAGAATLRVRDLLEAQDLMRLAKRQFSSIVSPTLLLHARDDEAASPRSSFEVASSIASQRVHCVILNDCYHMISIDKEKARVLSELKDFLTGTSSAADPQPPTLPLFQRAQRSTAHDSA